LTLAGFETKDDIAEMSPEMDKKERAARVLGSWEMCTWFAGHGGEVGLSISVDMFIPIHLYTHNLSTSPLPSQA